MRKFGFSGACGLDAGLRVMTHEHNGEEPSSDQSDKCHKAKKVLHDHPPFLMSSALQLVGSGLWRWLRLSLSGQMVTPLRFAHLRSALYCPFRHH